MYPKTTRVLAIILLAAFLVGLHMSPALAQGQKTVNINKATLDELCTLKRVGPSYAQRIIDHRNKNGPFKKPEDIMEVPGIGTRTFEANKDIIVCK